MLVENDDVLFICGKAALILTRCSFMELHATLYIIYHIYTNHCTLIGGWFTDQCSGGDEEKT